VLGLHPSLHLGTPGRLRAAAAHWRGGRFEEADRELSRALAEGSPATDAERAEAARLHFRLGQFDRATAALLALRPLADPELRAMEACIEAISRPGMEARLARARQRLGGATVLEPAAFGALIVNLALEHGQPALLPVALDQLGLAVRLSPGNARALNDLGISLGFLGREAEALAAFERAAAVDPWFPPSWFNLGRMAERRGRAEDAARHYRKALELEPSLTLARERLQALNR